MRRTKPERPHKYHPGRSPDNAKAIAAGELQVLVDFLRDLARIPGANRDKDTWQPLLLDRAMDSVIYAEALAAHIAPRGRGKPRDVFTISDAVRALEAAAEYKRLEGSRPTARLEKEIQNRHGVSRAVLRAALKGKLPDMELPGIPNAEK